LVDFACAILPVAALFPNAPYIVTDFIHLLPSAGGHWFDISLLMFSPDRCFLG
jgi:uncharacterized membrane protein